MATSPLFRYRKHANSILFRWYICDNNVLTLGSASTFAYCPQTANSTGTLTYRNYIPAGCDMVFLYAAFPNETTWIPTYWGSSDLTDSTKSPLTAINSVFASIQATPTWGPVLTGSSEYSNSAFYIFTVPEDGDKLEWTDHVSDRNNLSTHI